MPVTIAHKQDMNVGTLDIFAEPSSGQIPKEFALHDVQGGRKLHEQIDEAIRLHAKLLLILSHTPQ